MLFNFVYRKNCYIVGFFDSCLIVLNATNLKQKLDTRTSNQNKTLFAFNSVFVVNSKLTIFAL